jgi:hypothetical protein
MGTGVVTNGVDYTQLAEKQGALQKDLLHQQTAANRPDVTTANGYQRWAEGPDGRWSMQTGLSGPLSDAQQALQGQYAKNMSTPFDLSQFGQAQTGDAARDQAITAAYNQSTSRLDPMWAQRENSTRARLLNQGLSEDSAAFQSAMANQGRDRNDAYTSALASAIGQGTAAGDSAFRNNMMARQTSIAEALRARNMPGDELARLKGFEPGGGLNQAGLAQAPNYMGAAGMQEQANMSQAQQEGQMWSGGMGLLASLIGMGIMKSDERVKCDIVRLEEEAMPGVPYATWRYLPEHDPSGRRYKGVIAQDLEKMSPSHVLERDGIKWVRFPFLPQAID